MIISLVKDDPKPNPSGKRQFGPSYSLKGDPSSIWSRPNLPHSRKEQPLCLPRSGTQSTRPETYYKASSLAQ